jgi:GNAT superfamily N-acetyltransferase
VFGGCLQGKSKEIIIKLFLGQREDTIVSTSAVAFYKNISIYKGAEVLEGYRKKGINTQMIANWLNEARKYNCSWAVYQTSSTNIASINSVKKFGFIEGFRKKAFCKNFRLS